MAVSTVRRLVSKEKNRFYDKETGFDLDLTYITDRIIAMGFPSVGSEAMYRNPLPQVQRFFETRHPGHFKIYNLCAERGYELKNFFPGGSTERFPFKDHNPCPLEMLGRLCASVDAYLAEDPDNVVALHCKAGKGRTGLMVSAYLVHCGLCATAEEALEFFARRRTRNCKGVTIPSQIRFVFYYEQELLRGKAPVHTFQVTHVRFVTVPNFDVAGGCDPYFTVTVANDALDNCKVYDYRLHIPKKKIRKFKQKDHFVILDVSSHNLLIRDNVLFEFFDYDIGSVDDKMFHFWINTAYVENNYLCFEKSMLDKARKDKSCRHFDPLFKVELFLHKVEESGDRFNERFRAVVPGADAASGGGAWPPAAGAGGSSDGGAAMPYSPAASDGGDVVSFSPAGVERRPLA